MSDYAIDLLKAIEDGDRDTMSQAFNTAINAKVMDAIDAKKIEVAQSVYGVKAETEEESSVDSGEEVEVETTETSEENGSEEV